MHAGHEIALDELKRRLGRPGFVVVDVLPHATYVDGHIPRAVNLPLAQLRARAPVVLADRAADLAVYCGGPT